MKLIPRVGSRTWELSCMHPGDVRLFLAPAGRLSTLMQQIRTDIGRIGGDATTFNQSHILGVEPSTKTVIDIVKVTKL
jgi:hypothetical protein